MRAVAAAALLALACSGGKSLVLVEVSAGDPGIALTSVEISAAPAGDDAVTRRFDWNSGGGPLQAGVYLPGSVEGAVSVRASGSDATGAVEATGQVSVKPGQVSERVPLVLRRVGGPPPDGGSPPDGGPPPDGGAPPDGQAPDGPASEGGAPDTAQPDLPPLEPPSLTRCTVYEHAAPCTLTSTAAGVGVWEVVFSPDGRFLLTGGDDGRVKIWQVTPAGLVDDNRSFMPGPPNRSVHMAFSQDGTRLAVGGGDGTVAILEFPKMTRVATLMGHPAGIIYVAFSNDASRLVSIDSSWNLKLWNLATTKELKAFTFPTDLHSYSLSPGGQPASLWLATSDNNGTGFVLRDLAADPVTVINASVAMEVYAVAFSPDGQQLAVDTADGRMTLWDVSNKMRPVEGPALWAAPPATSNVLIATEAVFSTDGRFVAASGSLGYTAPGDIKLAQTVPPGLKGSVVTDSAAMSIDWSRDGKAIATGSWRCGKVTFCRD